MGIEISFPSQFPAKRPFHADAHGDPGEPFHQRHPFPGIQGNSQAVAFPGKFPAEAVYIQAAPAAFVRIRDDTVHTFKERRSRSQRSLHKIMDLGTGKMLTQHGENRCRHQDVPQMHDAV